MNLDFEREERTAIPEVVYCDGKSYKDIKKAITSFQSKSGSPVFGTRLSQKHGKKLRKDFPLLDYVRDSKTFLLGELKSQRIGKVSLVSAGNSDFFCLKEASRTLDFLCCDYLTINDVGVAGVHRILEKRHLLEQSQVVIVFAGMDGALPSVVGGITTRPIIAVPTSIGYGVSLNGLAPMLTMLNSCSPGVSVVNINNGFGAACSAFKIIKMIENE